MSDELSAEKAARAVGVGRATLYRWTRLPAPRSGKRLGQVLAMRRPSGSKASPQA